MSTNKKKVLLTGGRAPATLDLARKFKTYGCEVYVAESIQYHLCQYSNIITTCFTVPSPAKNRTDYLQVLSSLIQQYNIDLLVPMCEEIFYISSAIEQLSTLTEVFTEKIDIMQKLHNKFFFNKMIDGDEISVPATILFNSLEEYALLVDEGEITYPHVLKPAYSRFASQTKFIFSPKRIDIDVSEKRPWVAQRYIEGELICTYSICYKGKILANTFYKNNYTTGKNGAGISFREIENIKLLQWLHIFMKNLNYTGQIAFDIIMARDGSLWPIECNPRATSGIHLFSDEHNIPSAFLEHTPIETRLKSKGSPMLSLAMLLYGLSSIRSFSDLLNWFKCFFSGKDVVFRWNDPLPFLTQFSSILNFLKISRKNNVSLIEATTHDIEWNGN
ncbi:MAG: hypothetical protein K2Q33_04765 [Gammaproteobacteria bacterium]|nr:hypothetical protein [Gammaproteobacteria bacterium]